MSKITKRKFLKTSTVAGFGIISLRSGAVLASSSSTQCVVNNQKLAQRIQPDSLMNNSNFKLNDPWVRAQTVVRYIRNSANDECWIFQSPINPNQWFNEEDNTLSQNIYIDNGVVRGVRQMSGKGLTWQVIMGNQHIQGNVIAIFDSNYQNVIGYGLDTERSNITKSCYASINQGIR